MKLGSIISIVILISSCNNPQKNNEADSNNDLVQAEKKEVVASTNNKLKQEQNDNYSRLYLIDEECKLNLEEVATLFSLSASQTKTHIEVMAPCRFNINYRDGSEGIFSIRVIKTPQNAVQKAIENRLSSSTQKKYVKSSSHGGHYIFKHPNQGYLVLSHPNYANEIKIQYMVMVASGLTQTQREYVENKAYQAAEYLITKYKE
ncbi:MAG TPA: hypothetical protein DCS66_16870 [Flavobacteriaceae bacterium]|nr:hypothetical protein [Flavobacteriaceae bacterium]HAT66238.1 hypothetical protein [Flavobacteriaceae bacterium]|tara:strand:+ start:1087 stop:1698 length:612 start_codon:yes stop_codon:yes gene_type:complete